MWQGPKSLFSLKTVCGLRYVLIADEIGTNTPVLCQKPICEQWIDCESPRKGTGGTLKSEKLRQHQSFSAANPSCLETQSQVACRPPFRVCKHTHPIIANLEVLKLSSSTEQKLRLNHSQNKVDPFWPPLSCIHLPYLVWHGHGPADLASDLLFVRPTSRPSGS